MNNEPWATSRDAVPEGVTQITVYDEKTGDRIATVFDENAAKLIAAAPLLPDMAEVLRNMFNYAEECAADNDERPLCLGAARAVLRKWESMQ